MLCQSRSTIVPLLKGHPFCNEKEALKELWYLLEGIIYQHLHLKIWSEKRVGVWWECPDKRGDLWWEWSDKRGDLWWEWPDKRGDLWWEWPYKRGTTVVNYISSQNEKIQKAGNKKNDASHCLRPLLYIKE